MNKDLELNETKERMSGGYSFCLNEWALDKKIKAELPLLMIISSLSAESGVCFATNKYLAKLFDCTEISISQKINKLKKFGYITIEYEKRGCEIIKRLIRLKKFLTVDYKKIKSSDKKIFKDNNTSNNNINNNIPLNPLKGNKDIATIIELFKKIIKYHTGLEPNTTKWASSIYRWLIRNEIPAKRCIDVLVLYYKHLGDDEYMPKIRDLHEFYNKFNRLQDYFTDYGEL
ncbi:MAG: helix-turn-helix domain-containing protein [Methanobrevibacter sp.]|nr:helix-turn-helix domain-containing protein [Methanobrevibacter sp.]